jgi:hypothetical protein
VPRKPRGGTPPNITSPTAIQTAADTFVKEHCANVGKDDTAAFRARFVTAVTAGDKSAIIDLVETMAASYQPRRKERVDTSSSPTPEQILSQAGLDPYAGLRPPPPITNEEFDQLKADLVTLERLDDRVTLTIEDTKLGAITVTFTESDARANFDGRWIHELHELHGGERIPFGELESTETQRDQLTADAMAELMHALPQAVRDLTSSLWSRGIMKARAAQGWKAQRLEDFTNPENPFWGRNVRGVRPITHARRRRILIAYNRFLFERKCAPPASREELRTATKARRRPRGKQFWAQEFVEYLAGQGINLGTDSIEEYIWPRRRAK